MIIVIIIAAEKLTTSGCRPPPRMAARSCSAPSQIAAPSQALSALL